MKVKASFTVEAALLCPFLCLMLCGILLFTMRLYRSVDAYTEELMGRQKQELSSSELIRMETVTEDFFR